MNHAVPLFLIRTVGICYFLGAGFLVSRRLFAVSAVNALLLAPLVSIVPLTIVGSVLYFFDSLSTAAIAFLILIPCVTTFVMSALPPETPRSDFLDEKKCSRWSAIGLVFYSLVQCVFFWYLFTHRTTESLLGPWDHLSALPFVLYLFSSVILIVVFLRGVSASLGINALVLHFFVSFSVALIRFPLSFGFDPLLHHAAERIVLAAGVVNPKTFYYVGQYVLVPFFARVFSLPVEWIHQPLLMIIASCGIPPLAYLTLRDFFHFEKERSLLLILLLLAIPYPFFIMTTPWGLAYCIILITVLSSARACAMQSLPSAIFAGASAIFALTLHPLAGIPLCLFLILLALWYIKNHWLRNFFLVVGAILTSVSIPLAFFANSLLSPQFQITFAVPPFSELLNILPSLPVFPTRFLPFLDFVYFFSFNGWLFFALLSCVGAVLLFKNNNFVPTQSLSYHFLIVCLLMVCALRIEALLTGGFIHFQSLAVFEQQDYAERIVRIADIFLLPFAGYALGVFFMKLFSQKRTAILLVSPLFLAGILTASLYISYPRNDAYTPFHGHTLSSTDINAVHFIDKDGADEQFIVIANQVVASASIQEFGFKTYYEPIVDGAKQSVFYYPIPSGSPLAPFYYQMLSSPSRKTMSSAMRLVGVSRSYFVVRDYEPRFPIIVRDAKKSADSWRKIDGGKAYVFTYRL